jgi:hypothetical protein
MMIDKYKKSFILSHNFRFLFYVFQEGFIRLFLQVRSHHCPQRSGSRVRK